MAAHSRTILSSYILGIGHAQDPDLSPVNSLLVPCYIE